MPDEVKLYEVMGLIEFEDGECHNFTYLAPASSLEEANNLCQQRIEHLKHSPEVEIGERVVGGNAFHVREVDLTNFGYKVKLEKIVDSDSN